MLISVRTDAGNIVIDVDAGDPMEIIKHEIRHGHGVPWCQQRLVYAGRQLEDGMRILDYTIEGESTVFVVLRLPDGTQTSVERGVTDDKNGEHSSTDEDSECSNENQHNVWNPLLCVVHCSIGPLVQENLSGEGSARIGLCCHFSVDLLCVGFCDLSHG